MVSKTFIVDNKYGIHARPARLIVETAIQFEADIFISKDNEEINAKSIMGILMLEARKGTKLSIRCNGSDEEKALAKMEEIFDKISQLKEWEEA